MKIIHVVGWYFPDSSGGSEVYVAGLSRELQRLGHEVRIAAPHDGEGEREYAHGGIRVYRYPAGAGYLGNEVLGSAPAPSVETLWRWVERERPDLVHFHSWTRGLNYWHMRRLHEAGVPVYLTIHTASAFCPRVTMWRFNRKVCDGQLRPVRCAACYFNTRRVPSWLALVLAGAGGCGGLFEAACWGRARTVLGFPQVLRLRREQLQHTWQMSRKVVAVCMWVREALLLNDCPEEKILLCRQGCDQWSGMRRKEPSDQQGVLKIGFLGRLDYVKGVMILVDAFRRLPQECKVRLELKGIPQDQEYLRQLTHYIETDPRISLLGPSSPDHVREWLAQLDVLVVPSRWMETGPLVVYESFAAGVPVIGARHGGINELIWENVNGLLFEPQSSEALMKVLLQVYRDPGVLARLREGIGRPRSMQEVAVEMDALYRQMATSGAGR